MTGGRRGWLGPKLLAALERAALALLMELVDRAGALGAEFGFFGVVPLCT